MKLSPKQIAASVAGAVLAAVAASLFGAKGTMVGVALGSAVATAATALVGASIERTHRVVKQAVVKGGVRPPLLRRHGVNAPTGSVDGATDTSAVVEQPGTHGTEATGEAVDATEPVAATGPAEPVEPPPRLVADRRYPAAGPREPAGAVGGMARVTPDGRWKVSWPVLALSVGIVFLVTVVVVTAFELVAGRPLASFFGSDPATGGTSAGSLFSPPPTAVPPTTTTSSTTTSTTTTTTTTTVPGTSTTTTTGSTSTTAPGTTSSTTTSSTTTTTTAPGAVSTTTTSTTAPG